MDSRRYRIAAYGLLLVLLLASLAACVAPAAPAESGGAAAEAAPTMAAAAEGEAAEGESPYVASINRRKAEMADTAQFVKEGPYRIALAAQGPTNSWATLFDAHARAYVEELGPDVVSELLYADANGNADVQVPQVEDLLSQDPDALILVPMGRAALSAPVERAMAQGVPVILCASGVETDNFVTEVGTNLFESGQTVSQWLVDALGGSGNIVEMNGIAGVDTSEIAAQGAASVWAENPGITVLDTQYGNWSTAEGKRIMEQWIAQYGEEIDGIRSNGAQMSQGIIEAYLEAGLPIPPIAGGEYNNGFLRLAKENNVQFGGWHYPNSMVRVCIDAAISTLRGEEVPRFIDFKDRMEGTSTLTSDDIDTLYNPNWSDDVFGPVYLTDDQMRELGYMQ